MNTHINQNAFNTIRQDDLVSGTTSTTEGIIPVQVSYGITAFGGKVHESITKAAVKQADMSYGNLLDGVQWPDAPGKDDAKTDKIGTLLSINQPDTLANDSHHGKYQIWHSMAPDDGTGRIYSNGEVKDLIINQAVEWYEQAQSTGNSFHLGKVLHMIQDSYSRSHVMHDENGNIRNFQSYNEQDAHKHGTVDKPQLKTVFESNGMERQIPEDWQKIPGTLQALEASTVILKLFKNGANSKELADYLRDKVYPFENEQTKDMPAGGSDPKYQKRIAENTEAPNNITRSENAQLTSFGQMAASHAATLRIAEHIPAQYHVRLQELVNQRIVVHNLTVSLLEKTINHESQMLSA